MCLLFQNFASGWLKEDHFLPMLIPSRAFWSLTFCHLWFICLAYDFWKMKECEQWQPAFWKCLLKPWPQRTCQFGTWTVEMWNLSTERREWVRDGAGWTILLQMPARPKPFPCLVIHRTDGRSHLIPCESEACVACLLYAGTLLGFLHKAKKTWKAYFFPTSATCPTSYTYSEPLNQETWPDIYFQKLCAPGYS